MSANLHINLIDKRTLHDLMLGIASEGILQGALNERHGRPIDNNALHERIVDAITHIEAEMRVLGP